MTGAWVRGIFLKYFESKGHTILPSSSLIPQGDPTLLFTNAGMVQFKKVFTGEESRDFKRATTAQKCLRAGGKHNDFENVGKTARHHTFFEMLGNFSFGDYFKKEAIEFAWELVATIFKLDKSQLWVTIYSEDEDAFHLWRKIGFPEGRIVRMGEKDNFWSMGDTGPCGPCSEIIYDQGSDVGCKRKECVVGCDCDRFLEIWNLVFMQYERLPDGRLQPLPKPSIDTGMGLERITAVLQGVKSNYDSDLFKGIIQSVEKLSGKEYGESLDGDVSMRVIADHIRAIVFLIADGILPSNEGRGYVLRRIIRRASRYGKKLDIDPPFLVKLADSVEASLAQQYPEILSRREVIKSVIKAEEEKFAETLEKGIQIFNEEISKLSDRFLPGEIAFKLYDTYGFPVDITEDMAREAGIFFDRKGFEDALEEQRTRSRAGMKQAEARTVGIYADISVGGVRVDFLGYDTTSADGKVLFIIKDGEKVDEASAGEEIEVITDRTPFYGEAGGQVGDTGTIKGMDLECEVIDTQKPFPDIIIHRCRVKRGKIKVNSTVNLQVHLVRRRDIASNHTATHLLHSALRRILGEHVRQSGSLVAPDRFRFDFTHYSSLTQSQLNDIEELVNQKIKESIPVNTYVVGYNEALSRGALAFFDEKYGEKVRMVEIDDYSRELCGGTHVKNTGEIGILKIVSESSISAGVRRIEAITGRGIIGYVRGIEQRLREIATVLKTSEDGILDRIKKMNEAIKELEIEKDALQKRLVAKDSMVKREWKKTVGDVNIIIQLLDNLDEKMMLELHDKLKVNNDSSLILLISEQGSKVSLIASVSKKISHRFDASAWLKHILVPIGGKGGGRRELARGSGTRIDKIEEAVNEAFRWVEEHA